MAAPVHRSITPTNQPIIAHAPVPAEAEHALAQLRKSLEKASIPAVKAVLQVRIDDLMRRFPTLR
jgi:hypothetical protein